MSSTHIYAHALPYTKHTLARAHTYRTRHTYRDPSVCHGCISAGGVAGKAGADESRQVSSNGCRSSVKSGATMPRTPQGTGRRRGGQKGGGRCHHLTYPGTLHEGGRMRNVCTHACSGRLSWNPARSSEDGGRRMMHAPATAATCTRAHTHLYSRIHSPWHPGAGSVIALYSPQVP